MAKFIEIKDIGGTVHIINVLQIIEISQYGDNETNIALSNGTVIYTTVNRINILKQINQ